MTSLYSSSSAKERLHLLERFDQRVDVFMRVVHVERCPGRGWHAQDPHQDLRAMMPRPHAYAFLVEHLGQVVGMDVAVPEGDGATPRLGVLRPEHPRARIRQPLDRIPC